jgi:hypothetical protein
MKCDLQSARRLLLLLLLVSCPTAAWAQHNDSTKEVADTPALDVSIAKAEAKASSPSASASDKGAAAAAYLERGNIYYNAQTPRLYKFALADFRRALKYQPDLTEAREKADQIESIYRSLGRPVPLNGNEPPEKLNETVAGARRVELKSESGLATGRTKDEVETGGIRDYVFTARAGQTISVSSQSEKQAVHFNLYQVRDGALIRWALDVGNWSGEITQTGEYVIRVGPVRGKSEFTLQVKSSKTTATRKF